MITPFNILLIGSIIACMAAYHFGHRSGVRKTRKATAQMIKAISSFRKEGV